MSEELITAPPPAQPRRATIKEVAEAAGVSRSTASRALAGNGYVAEHVRQRVRDAARELGYVVDVTARSLKQQSSRTIGVLVSDLRNAFYAELASGAAREARKRGFTVMLIDDRGSAEDELEAAEAFVSSRVAGVVATPVAAQLVEFLRQHRVPLVEVDRRFAPSEADAVVIDNRAAARDTTDHLLDLGHRRIALFIDETDWTTGRERLQGYTDALAARRLRRDDALVVSTGWDVGAAYHAAVEILSGPDRPTAIFAANNVLAEGAWRAAARLSLGVPGELSLVSFDEAPWMSMVEPGLTAILQDAEGLGQSALRTLLDRIDAPQAPVRTVVLPVSLIERGSTAPPRTA